jgi:nucleoid DNA-binding protein
MQPTSATQRRQQIQRLELRGFGQDRERNARKQHQIGTGKPGRSACGEQ